MTNTEIATSYMPGDQSGDIILQTPIHWMGQLYSRNQDTESLTWQLMMVYLL